MIRCDEEWYDQWVQEWCYCVDVLSDVIKV